MINVSHCINSYQSSAPFAAPVFVTVTEVTSSRITVQWGPVDCIHRNGDITGYLVQYGSETTVFAPGGSSGGFYDIIGLISTTAYSIQVAAKNSVGTGPYSSPITQLTASGG